jgi:hypothetical protein
MAGKLEFPIVEQKNFHHSFCRKYQPIFTNARLFV